MRGTRTRVANAASCCGGSPDPQDPDDRRRVRAAGRGGDAAVRERISVQRHAIEVEAEEGQTKERENAQSTRKEQSTQHAKLTFYAKHTNQTKHTKHTQK